jgi:hypothetical protein
MTYQEPRKPPVTRIVKDFETKLHSLQVWEEIVGVLQQITKQGEGNVVVNVSGNLCILKNFPEALLKKLQNHRKCSVGILHTDSGYAIRVAAKHRRAIRGE